jgi:hypothetical protein
MTAPKQYRACEFPLAVRCFGPDKSAEAFIPRIFELLGAQLYSTGALVKFDVWMVELQLELVANQHPPAAPFCGAKGTVDTATKKLQ